MHSQPCVVAETAEQPELHEQSIKDPPSERTGQKALSIVVEAETEMTPSVARVITLNVELKAQQIDQLTDNTNLEDFEG